MCGITAVFGDYKNKESFMKDSLEKIKHRGTSFFELRVFEKGALGANRLPIVGRETGFQPLSNEDDTIFAAQNGEIFNYKKLRNELEKRGHIFKTDCDTEILTHLFEEYGEKMIYKIDSEMFAFVVYDIKKNRYLVARDPFGVKPLYYGQDNKGNYFFGSELKQLVQFNFLKEVKIFPKGSYMINGKIKKYHELEYSNKIKNEKFAKEKLKKLIIEAVKKRVDTDLPIAVLLSGGVDSSLIMELATRYHNNVTGFILGLPGSSDYEAALKLCKERDYKYQVVYPNVDYLKEFESLIYHLEMYEAQVIRQSFALDILAKEVVRAGFRVALVGEASDELFGGYNEFSRLSTEKINEGCYLITNDLERSHNMRVDRMSMKHTLETRAPFFDTAVADFALQIDGSLKVKKENHQVTTKYILRKVAEEFLPDYITWRYKVPFANGAGMNVGFNFKSQDGDVARTVLSENKGQLDEKTKKKYGFITEEELVYFDKYREFKFNKLYNNKKRIVTKETLSEIDQTTGKYRMLVAEFGKMPQYFPIYLTAKLGYFKSHNLEIDFISSGGDDLTYNSLMSGSAQIGIADPVFTFATNFKTKGKIVGQLIGKAPVVAVTLNPQIKINKINDFNKYKIGTYQEFSTTNTIAKSFLPDKKLISYKPDDLIVALKDKKIDIAIISNDYAIGMAGNKAKIVYSFQNNFKDYSFTGITICDNLDPQFTPAIKSFLAAIRETFSFIKKDRAKTLKYLEGEFPQMENHSDLLDALLNVWDKKLKVSTSGLENARQTWHKVYPWLLKASNPQFIKPTLSDEIIKILCQRNISRDIPYKEDEIAKRIEKSILKNKPIELTGFWGASDKNKVDSYDLSAIKRLKKIGDQVKKIYKPGLVYKFILADEHARLNNYKKDDYLKYLKEINKILKNSGYSTVYLSKTWQKHKFSERTIKNNLKSLTDGFWRDLANRQELENSSKRLGFKDYKKEAKRYFLMRKLESEILKNEYKDIIYWAFSSDINQSLFGDMPTLYLWTDGEGHGEAPWFKK